MKDQDELETILQKRLKELKTAPERDFKIAAQRRAQFLGKAVSVSEVHRHKIRMVTFRKENFAMNLIISILVIAGLVFGGGTAVYAAQDDLPDEPLYAVKVWSEETRLQFQKDPQEKADYLMTMARTRIQEMARLVEDEQPIPEEIVLRLEQHIQQALQLCTDMDDTVCDQIRLQIRARLQEQERLMQQLLIDAPEDVRPILQRTRDMLRLHLCLVEDCTLSGETNQNMIQNQNQNGQNDEFTPPAQTGTGTQFNQPTDVPGGPNNPGGPNTDAGNSNPGGPNTDSGNSNSGGPNTDSGNPNPGGPNTDAGNGNPDPGGPNPDAGNGTGSDNSGGNNSNGGGGKGNKP